MDRRAGGFSDCFTQCVPDKRSRTAASPISRLRAVAICRPEPFAAIVPGNARRTRGVTAP